MLKGFVTNVIHLGEKLIKIDHHPNEDPYGDLLWVDTSASSCSEMIYEFYLNGKDKGLKMNDAAARLLYAGIVGDTGRFLFPSTTEKTLGYAGELIHYNFSRTELFDKMYELDTNIIKLNGYILQNFELQNNGVASVKLTKELLKEYNAKPAEASLLSWNIRKCKRNKGMGIFHRGRRTNKGASAFKGSCHQWSCKEV